MNKNELYLTLCAMVPITPNETEDYRAIIKKHLRKYLNLLKQLDKCYRPPKWMEIYNRTEQLCDGINRSIEAEYRGVRHSAYTSIKNQLDGYKIQNKFVSGLSYNISSMASGMRFFRMRKVSLEEQRNLKPADIFHIPLNMRGLVQSQRYSAIGYPCLYVSHTIYGCWEEMGRPDFGSAMVSQLINKLDFNVLDLRVPSEEQWDKNMGKCIQFFPLIIASMVQTKNEKDTYKPEYLIPQLLTEWIISRNRDKKKSTQQEIIGIVYTSAQKNSDFDFPANSYDNYAIPVLNPLGYGNYCSKLVSQFTVTKPTYYDLEVLKQGNIIDSGNFDSNAEDNKKEHLSISPFDIMEKYIEKQDSVSIDIYGHVK